MIEVPDHPEIRWAEATGYPSWKQEDESHYCENCGECLDDKEAYEDRYHDWLCKDCLLTLHEKDR